ncbi:GntR family transcriptional regulator [Roseateles violae]|uniref:GntR family transcriptional regulator n=1 Tax=Roseateles violae TaxID=3058042 RepID=A0ABT8DPK9_9BURK|nr:GntR family transcriptional regulator [Pelomonas sp. PFR6]MDN3920291.1 GntR family transcriptional regulator [Pelomonas sp. PFR6]
MKEFMPLPKYHRVYLVLKQRLAEGLYDAAVPGEIELMEEFAVSRATIRKALGTLSDEGLIERSAGRGTRRIPPSPTSQAAGQPHGLLDSLVALHHETTVQVLEHELIAATDPVARALRLTAGAEVLRTARVRSTRDGPVSYIVAWVPAAHSRGLTRRQLERKPLLSLLEESGLTITRASQTVSARQADSEVARHLGVPVGSALLAVSRVLFDGDDKPVQWLQGLYRPDRYEYEMQLSRSKDENMTRVWIGKELSTLI